VIAFNATSCHTNNIEVHIRERDMKQLLMLTAAIASLGMLSTAGVRQESTRLEKVQQALKDDVPHILCVDERIATGGQPTDSAFAKLAANGYRAVLSLRTATEGVDPKHQQEAVEKAGMRYINIPVLSSAPNPAQVDEFIRAVKNKDNQPMLVHCGSANRVGAFWMIYRVVDQGWTEDMALEEAIKIGLTSPVLKSFAHEYIGSHAPRKAASD
jgi:uncharacterized protein (TIGR01244 family)